MRISGINIPENKKLQIALTYIYGIGNSASLDILKQAKISPEKRTKELSQEEEKKLRDIISQKRVEGDLRREITGNIRRLKNIKCYRGQRHAKNLPVRGQRTKTNSRTARGNVRRTMTSGRRKLEKK